MSNDRKPLSDTREGKPQERVLNGFPVFPSRGRVVTDELIQRLLDEEDEEIIARFHRRPAE